jgi:hypothetical protein
MENKIKFFFQFNPIKKVEKINSSNLKHVINLSLD